MKRVFSWTLLSLFICSAGWGADNARPAVAGKMVMSAPRYTASVNQLNGTGNMQRNVNLGGQSSDLQPVTEPVVEPVQLVVDTREAERSACLNNNIGIGNTFVWASKDSDTSNYANMVEDTKNPANNSCFVRVELKSDDGTRVSVDDVPAKYFMWGQNVTCGSWANAKEIEKRILDAKKGARVGGVVASTVGAAGIGFGAMELFGNKLIGGKVMGQKDKDLSAEDLYVSMFASYDKKDQVIKALKQIQNNGETLKAGQRAVLERYGNNN